MKNLLLLLVFSSLVFNSCTSSIGQQPSLEKKQEDEFYELMKKVNEVRKQNENVMKAADNKTKSVIEKTAEKIETLKDENKKLKQEINETGKKYYPIDDTISDFQFTLRPVSEDKKNR